MKYFIVLNKNGKNQLEIYHSIFAKQTLLPKEDAIIINTAKTYDEAIQIVRDLTEEVYEQTGGADLRAYLLERHRNQEESVGQ